MGAVAAYQFEFLFSMQSGPYRPGLAES